jgi:hypothetical protein
MTDFAATRVTLTGVPAEIGIAQGVKASGILSVLIRGVITDTQAARDVTFASGDRVLVQRIGEIWVAVCRIDTAATTTPADVPTPPAPKPQTVFGRTVITPVETRSYRPTFGWRTDNTDVYQGEYGSNGNHTGCAFYGGKPRSLAGATVTGAVVKLRRLSSGGAASAQALTLALIDQATRPGGAPTRNDTTAGPSLRWGQTHDGFTIPTSWAQELVDGTSGGLGVFDAGGSPYMILAGRSRWSGSFALAISWKRQA